MRIAVIGLGAVGGLVAARLARAAFERLVADSVPTRAARAG